MSRPYEVWLGDVDYSGRPWPSPMWARRFAAFRSAVLLICRTVDTRPEFRIKIRKGLTRRPFFNLAGGRGLEPRLTVSETAVLPLDDPPFRGRTIIA